MLRKLDNTPVTGYWPAADLVASLEPGARPLATGHLLGSACPCCCRSA